jgi:enamine deaminase RidA (YjgF/YER057c/UK114 family)
VVDLDSTRSKAVQAAKAKYFTQENQPASTMVGVSALVMKPLLVEIEATAVVEI